MRWTTHGHQAMNGPLTAPPAMTARCGGPSLCAQCSRESGQLLLTPVLTGSPAYQCECCHHQPHWRIDRVGDSVVSWACFSHLTQVCVHLHRDGERTELTVREIEDVTV